MLCTSFSYSLSVTVLTNMLCHTCTVLPAIRLLGVVFFAFFWNGGGRRQEGEGSRSTRKLVMARSAVLPTQRGVNVFDLTLSGVGTAGMLRCSLPILLVRSRKGQHQCAISA